MLRIIAATLLALAAGVCTASPGGQFTPEPLGRQQWAFGSTKGDLAPENAGFAGFGDVVSRFNGTGVRIAILDRGGSPGTAVSKRGRVVRETTSQVLPGHDFVSRTPEAIEACKKGIRAENPWHGVAMESIISAQKNGFGFAGVAPGASIQHVRVLGCRSPMKALVDGIVWASCGEVAGVPKNPTPAHVINMSLSVPRVFEGQCPAELQEAIDFAISKGVILVASTNNSSEQLGRTLPASCRGVIGVGASTRNGDLWAKSNRDPSLAIYAPSGGECANKESRVPCDKTGAVSLSNAARDGVWRANHARFCTKPGASVSAAFVSGAAALLKQARPDATPDQIRRWLVDGSREHPEHSICRKPEGRCGSGGLLDVRKSMDLALAEAPEQLAKAATKP